MSELNKYKLGDLGFFFGGVTSIKKEDYGHGTPFLPYKNVYKNSKVDVNELELMNVRPLDLERRNAIYGDIFFTASSETPDEVAMSSVLLDEVENLTFNGFCKRFRLNDFNTLLPEYARYLFRDVSFRREVYQLATGDIRFNISQESLANIEIEIPDVITQKQLVEILITVDDKIELLQQMNQTLEGIAQAIFKEWFVDFNFPEFDGELVDGLPKGWKVGKIKDVYKTTSGGTPSRAKGEYYENGTINWVKSKELNGNFIFDTDEKITEDAVKNSSAKLIPRHSILLAMYGATVGEYAITGRETTCNQAICAVIEKEFPYTYFFEYFKNNRNSIIGRASGSAQQNISQALIQQLEILIPSIETVNNYHLVVEPLFNKMEENLLQIQTLTQTRDTLLPRLMSGRLEIKN